MPPSLRTVTQAFAASAFVSAASGSSSLTGMISDVHSHPYALAPEAAQEVAPARGLAAAFTSSTLRTAITAWCSDPAAATTTYGGIGTWDTSGVLGLDQLVATYCGSVATFNSDITSWDTSSVTSLFFTFAYATAFNRGIGSWDVSSVTIMSQLFESASSFKQDIGAWDVGRLKDASLLFHKASAFNQDISTWDVGKCTTLSLTFTYASTFNQPIGTWDVSSVTTLTQLFQVATEFNQDISAWDTSKVVDMSILFNAAAAFNHALGAWDVSKVTNMIYMFAGANDFSQAIGAWDISKVTSTANMFQAANKFNQALDVWDLANVASLASMFLNAAKFNQVLCWDLSGKTTTSMFSGSSGSVNLGASKCLCAAGTYWSGTSCAPCPPGYFSRGQAVACTPCPAGSFEASPGSSSCEGCAAGKFSSAVGRPTACSDVCPGGTYSVGGAASCTPCPVGNYRAATANATTCASCPAGEYQASPGQTACVSCGAGRYSSASGRATDCADRCSAGKTSSAGATTCEDCSGGAYQPLTGQSTCALCGAGTFSPPGATACTPCDAGKSSVGNQAACVACIAGTFAASTGTPSPCGDCAAGRYASASGATACAECAATKSSPPGSSSCAVDGGACVTPACATAGNYLNCSAVAAELVAAGCLTNCTCVACARGRASPVALSLSPVSCVACGPGQAANASGSAACVACAAGTYASDRAGDGGGGQDRQTLSGAHTCNACPAGLFTSTQATIVCQTCAGGKVSGGGAVACTACPAGSFSPSGAKACHRCPAGTFAPDECATSCGSCATLVGVGYTSMAGAPSCDQCQPGFYRSVGVQGSCVACPLHSKCLHGAGSALAAPAKGYWVDTATEAAVGSAAESDGGPELVLFKCARATCTGSDPAASGCWASGDALAGCDADALLCSEGATGPLCGSCANGYYFAPSSSRCRACASSPAPFLASNVGAVVVACGAVVSAGALAAAGLWQDKHSGGRLGLRRWLVSKLRHLWVVGAVNHVDGGAAKVVFTSFQIVASASGSIDVAWPAVFLDFTAAFSFLKVDFDAARCWGLGVYDAIYLKSALPVVLGAVVVLAAVVRLKWAVREAARTGGDAPALGSAAAWKEIKAQHSWLLLLLTYMVLPPISLAQLSALDCVRLVPAPGHVYSVLRTDTAVDCDSDAHRTFAAVDAFLIAAYLCIPALWLAVLARSKHRLMPSTAASDKHVVRLRQLDAQLAPLRFLFDSYRPSLWWWEAVEMWRRVFFVSVVPLLSSSALDRGLIGLLASLVSLVVYYEACPFASQATNGLAHVAQVAIFATYGAAVVLASDAGDGGGRFKGAGASLCLGAVLVAVNALLVLVAAAAAASRHARDQEIRWRERERVKVRVEWAVGFSDEKFKTTFDFASKHAVPSSHALVFWYGTLAEVEGAARCGLPVPKAQGGLCFTTGRPATLTLEERALFGACEAMLALSLPRQLLFPVPAAPTTTGAAAPVARGDARPASTDGRGPPIGLARVRRLGPEVLAALRPAVFAKDGRSTVADVRLWAAGVVLVPPHCVKRAYQLTPKQAATQETERGAVVAGDALAAVLAAQKAEAKAATGGDASIIASASDLPFLVDRGALAADAHVASLKVTRVTTSARPFTDEMADVRRRCALQGLVPLYHYTSHANWDLIRTGGLRMSTQGQGDGGVYFSTKGPASFGFGLLNEASGGSSSSSFEENIIADCFGPSRVNEYLGLNKLDLCLVYACEPRSLTQAPGGRNTARVVSRACFEDFSLPHENGCYFLRPDRLAAAFLMDAAHPPAPDHAPCLWRAEQQAGRGVVGSAGTGTGTGTGTGSVFEALQAEAAADAASLVVLVEIDRSLGLNATSSYRESHRESRSASRSASRSVSRSASTASSIPKLGAVPAAQGAWTRGRAASALSDDSARGYGSSAADQSDGRLSSGLFAVNPLAAMNRLYGRSYTVDRINEGVEDEGLAKESEMKPLGENKGVFVTGQLAANEV